MVLRELNLLQMRRQPLVVENNLNVRSIKSGSANELHVIARFKIDPWGVLSLRISQERGRERDKYSKKKTQF
jgi:hypothetical protein